MLRPRLTLVLGALLLTSAFSLQGQQLRPGDRLRVSRACNPGEHCALLDGRLVSWHGSTLTLAGDRAVEVMPDTKVEVFRGSRGHALTGLLVGTLAGTVIGAMSADRCTNGGFRTMTDGVCAGYSIVGGIAAGALGGLITGALLRSERWERVVHPTISLGGAAGTLGLGARVRF